MTEAERARAGGSGSSQGGLAAVIERRRRSFDDADDFHDERLPSADVEDELESESPAIRN